MTIVLKDILIEAHLLDRYFEGYVPVDLSVQGVARALAPQYPDRVGAGPVIISET
jgi:hypothetical protein